MIGSFQTDFPADIPFAEQWISLLPLAGKAGNFLFTTALSLIVYNHTRQKKDTEMNGLLTGSQKIYLSSV